MDWDLFFRDTIKPMEAYRPGLREDQIREIAQSDVIHKLSSNESPLPPFAAALEAMAAALPSLNEYPDGSCFELRAKLAQHSGVKMEHIVCGNGTNELLTLIAETTLAPSSNVVYGWPSFIVYRYAAQLMGAEFREVALRDDGSFDLQAMLAQIDEYTKIVYVCSPNNPTGPCVTRGELRSFLEQVPGHVLVVLDCAYDEFIVGRNDCDEAPADPMEFFDGQRPLVVLKTFSKLYALAGIRVGYGFAPEPVVQMVERVREPFNVNTAAQAAAVASLTDGDELIRRRNLNASQRERLYKLFAQLGLKYYQSQANYVWVEVPDAQALFDYLLKAGVIVRPFAGANGLRVGVGNIESTDATIAAFEQYFSES